MCRYSNRCKSIVARAIIALAIIILGLGIAVGILGIYAMGVLQTPEQLIDYDFMANLNAGQQLGLLFLILGLLSILISICGCLSSWIKKPIFTVPLILLSIIVGIALFIIGALTSDLGGVVDQSIDFACNQTFGTMSNLFIASVDKFTCSKTCPCPKGPNGEYEKYWKSIPDEVLFAANRRSKLEQLNLDQKTEWRFFGDNSKITPLVFNSTEETTTYESFYKCFQDKIKAEMQNSNPFYTDIKNFLDTGGYELFSYFEGNFNCSSVCKLPLFYMTKSIALKRPPTECFGPVVATLQTDMGAVSTVSLVSGFVLIIIAITAWPLCSGLKDEDDDGENVVIL